MTVSYVGSDDNNLSSSNNGNNGNKNYSRRTSIVTNNVMTGCVNSNIHNTNNSINNSSDIKNNNDSLNNCNGNMKTNYNDIKNNNNNNNNDLDRFEENFYCVSLNDTGSMLPSDLDTKNDNRIGNGGGITIFNLFPFKLCDRFSFFVSRSEGSILPVSFKLTQ